MNESNYAPCTKKGRVPSKDIVNISKRLRRLAGPLFDSDFRENSLHTRLFSKYNCQVVWTFFCEVAI